MSFCTQFNQGYGEKEDLNCAEKILYGANDYYKLGLDRETMKLASGFGWGMGIEDKCGALAASIMVLGKLFVKERAHESMHSRELAKSVWDNFQDEMGMIDCAALKDKYRTEELKCRFVITKAAETLEKIIDQERRRLGQPAEQADAWL